MSQSKNITVDIAKGIGMICIIVGHMGNATTFKTIFHYGVTSLPF